MRNHQTRQDQPVEEGDVTAWHNKSLLILSVNVCACASHCESGEQLQQKIKWLLLTLKG
jgi:hypothetical protein